ncbi:MAG: cell division protein ZipA [Vibrio sp.]
MLDLQSVLVLVGSLAVIGIIAHGLWLSKKEKKSKFAQAREEEQVAAMNKTAAPKPSVQPSVATESVSAAKPVKGSKSRQEPGFSQLDASGFDADDELDDPLFRANSAAIPGSQQAQMQAAAHKTSAAQPTSQQVTTAQPQAQATPAKKVIVDPSVADEAIDPVAQPDLTQTVAQMEAGEILDEAPSMQASDDTAPAATQTAEVTTPVNNQSAEQVVVKTEPNTTEQTASTERVEPSLSALDAEPEVTVETLVAPKVVEKPEPEYIVVNVHTASDNQPFVGTELFDAMSQLGLHYGEMDIFHRHIDPSGTGKVLFSVANMLNPGTFAHTDPAQFTTKGVSFFMSLPCCGEAKQNFKLMLRTAQQLADDLSANVLDEKRNLMTADRIDAYQEQVRDFCAREKEYQAYQASLEAK